MNLLNCNRNPEMRGLSGRLMKSPRRGKRRLAGIMTGFISRLDSKLTASCCGITPLRGCPADILVDGLPHLVEPFEKNDVQAETRARKKQTTQLYKAANELLQLQTLNALILKVNLQGTAILSVVYNITSSPGTLRTLSVQLKATYQTYSC